MSDKPPAPTTPEEAVSRLEDIIKALHVLSERYGETPRKLTVVGKLSHAYNTVAEDLQEVLDALK